MPEAFLQATVQSFMALRKQAEAALEQIDDEVFFAAPGPRNSSLAMIVKHVGGNLKSRWTDFLTTDGEKEDRNRDGEFIVSEDRTALMKVWDEGWKALLSTLDGLKDEDLAKTVFIRGEAHSVPLAIQRSLAHTGWHVGQILYVARLLKEGDWNWLTIPPGGSADFNRKRKG